MNKILIVGLGNPGKKYQYSPHNAGFAVIDELAEKLAKYDVPHTQKNTKEYALWHAPQLEEQNIIFAKPLLYMNRSGEAVKKLITNYGLPVADYSNVWIAHDDVDLPLGKVRVQFGGSSAGHKGVKDIIEKLGTKDFYRFRVGVLPEDMPIKRDKELMNKFITKKLPRKHRKAFKSSVELCSGLIEQAVDTDIEKITGDHSIK